MLRVQPYRIQVVRGSDLRSTIWTPPDERDGYSAGYSAIASVHSRAERPVSTSSRAPAWASVSEAT